MKLPFHLYLDVGLRNADEWRSTKNTMQWQPHPRIFVDLVNFSRADACALEGGFYDYFQTSLYFDSSIRLQKEFRQELLNFFEQRERDIRTHALRTR